MPQSHASTGQHPLLVNLEPMYIEPRDTPDRKRAVWFWHYIIHVLFSDASPNPAIATYVMSDDDCVDPTLHASITAATLVQPRSISLL